MIHTPFRTVLEDVLGIAGYPYDGATQSQLDQAARFINRHLRTFWEWGQWPEWTRAEARAFASPWYATVTYATNDIVWSLTQLKYYKALQSSTNQSVTNASYWESIDTPIAREIARNQVGLRIMGRVWRVTKHNPYFTARGDQYTFVFNEIDNGISVRDCNQNTVWVLFSDPAPLFTAKAYDPTVAAANQYQRYDVVYYPGEETVNSFPQKGLCYVAEYDSTGAAVWIPVYFPRIAQHYVVNKSAADMLRHYGQKESAIIYDQQAELGLLNEWDKINTPSFQGIIGVAP